MEQSHDTRINDALIALAQHTLKDSSVSPQLIKRLQRQLRPADAGNSVDYSIAIKRKIEKKLMNDDMLSRSGVDAVAIFNREYDTLRKSPNARSNMSLVSMMEPLSSFQGLKRSTYFNPHLTNVQSTPVTTDIHAASIPDTASTPVQYVASTLDNIITTAEPSEVGTNPSPEQIASLQSHSLTLSRDVEIALMRDLLYVFQGIAGNVIKYDTRSQCYVVDPSLKLRQPVMDIVYSLCEIGWLYKKVDAYLKPLQQQESTNGLVAHAFASSLQEELHDYFRLLAVLEQQLSLMSSNGTGELSLVRLHVWLQQPFNRLYAMARLVDTATVVHGGALLSRLHLHTKHGDDDNLVSFCERLLVSASSPLYTFIARWVLYGELCDVQNEFFVCVRQGVSETDMWRDRYYIRYDLLPSFLSAHLAVVIYRIGRTINFIKHCELTASEQDDRRGSTKPRIDATARYQASHMVYASPEVPAQQPHVAREAEMSSTHTIVPAVHKLVNPFAANASSGTPSRTPHSTSSRHSTPHRAGSMSVGSVTSGLSVSRQDRDRDMGNRNLMHDISEEGFDDSDEEATMPPSNISPVKAFFQSDLLQEYDGARESALPRPLSQEEIVHTLTTLQYGDDDRVLEDCVNQISVTVDSKLLHVMHSRAHVYTHLNALKKFILLGQGDFVTCLMDHMGVELKKRANQIYRHNLSGMLEASLRGSNAQYEPLHVQDRIGVCLLEAKSGDSGWEIFALDYRVNSPLSAIVHDNAMVRYRQAFQMLWRWKRVEWHLAGAWKKLLSFRHAKGLIVLPKLGPHIHRCTLFRSRMLHVVNNFCAFLMFEVLESAWLQLQTGLNSANNLDDVIAAHDEYLQEILHKSMLTPAHEVLKLQVDQLIQTMLRFCNLEEQLFTDAMVALNRQRSFMSQVGERTSAGEWGVSSNEGFEFAPDTVEGVPVTVLQRLEGTFVDFSNQFSILMNLFNQQGDKVGEILKFLSFRLDFNGYFDQTPKAFEPFGQVVGSTSARPAADSMSVISSINSLPAVPHLDASYASSLGKQFHHLSSHMTKAAPPPAKGASEVSGGQHTATQPFSTHGSTNNIGTTRTPKNNG